MAIPTIQVPSAQRQVERPKEKRDLIEDILRGLQIAQGVTGMAVNTQRFLETAEQAPLKQEILAAQAGQAQAQAQVAQQTAAAQERQVRGEFVSPIEARQAGFIQAPEGVTGIPATVAGQPEELVSEKDLMVQVRQESAASQAALQKAQAEFKDEQGLRKEFSALPVTKNTELLAESYDKILRSAELKTGAGDIGVIFSYMKMLDPGSTVREGEFATAQNAGSVPENVRNMWNKMMRGEKLAINRQQFVDVASTLLQGQLERFKGTADQYGRIATERGFQPENVIPQRPLKLMQELSSQPAAAPQGTIQAAGPGQPQAAPKPRRIRNIDDLPSLR